MNAEDLRYLRFSHTSEWDTAAIRAHQRYCERNGYLFEQPTKPSTFRDRRSGAEFVVLYNRDGVIAVYCVRSTRLQRLQDWPPALSKIL